MNRHQIILIGGGGHAKVVFEAACTHLTPIGGFVDDLAECPLAHLIQSVAYSKESHRHFGTLESIYARSFWKAHTYQTENNPIELKGFLAIGSLNIRERVLEQLDNSQFNQWSSPIAHRSAIISPSATLQDGVFVSAGAIINADASISHHAIINTGAVIEHDCSVGINTHIAPSATLTGAVEVGDHTLIGARSVVLPGVHIGSHCIIGAGTVVTKNVEDGETVIGSPARMVAHA